MLGYAIYQKNVVSTDQIYDGVNGNRFQPHESAVRAQMAAVRSPVLPCRTRGSGALPTFFKVPLRFDAEHTALVFPTTWLDRLMHGVNPQLRRILESEIEALDLLSDGNFVQPVASGPAEPDRRGMSFRGSRQLCILAMHRRTLNRRLNALGITFKQLLDETRFEIAQQLLRDTRMPMVDIAVTLNYADTSALPARSAAGPVQPRRLASSLSTINHIVSLTLPVRVRRHTG